MVTTPPLEATCGASGLACDDLRIVVLGGGGMRGTLHLRGGALALGVGDVDARSSGETMRGGVRGSELRADLPRRGDGATPARDALAEEDAGNA